MHRFFQILFCFGLPFIGIGQSIDSLRNEFQNMKDDTSKFNLVYQSSVDVLMHDFEAAFEFGAEALAVAKKIDAPRRVAKAKTAMGTARFYAAQHAEAEELFLDAQQIYDSLSMSAEQASGLGRLGALYMNMSKYTLAEDYYNRSIRLFRRRGDSLGVARNYLNIGLIYDYTGDEQLAAEFYKRSERIGDVMGDDKTSSYAKNNFASLLFKQGNYTQAKQHYLDCIDLGNKMKDNFLLADSYFMLSKTLLQLQQLEEARSYLNKALAIDEAQRNVRGQCMKWALFGEINETDGALQQARSDFERSLEFALKAEDKDQVMPVSLLNLGRIERKLKDFKASMSHLEAAVLSAKNSGVRQYQADALGELAFTLSAMEDTKQAFVMLDLSHRLKDSLVNRANSEHINRLEALYENEKKEGEIDRLNIENELALAREYKANQILFVSLLLLLFVGVLATLLFRSNRFKQRTNRILEKQNLEKAALLKEIHHRVKNNLQVISSLLNLQSANLSDAGALDAIKEGQNRVKSIALIHQKLYQTEDISKVDFQEYCTQLTDFLGSTFSIPGQEVSLKVNAKNIHLDIDTAVPLGLIINELVTNAFKYAFVNRSKGVISISVAPHPSLKEGMYLLSVWDDGTGIADGVVIKNSKSLGMRLVHMLTRQIKGEVFWVNDGGAVFNITFNESKASKKA